jgi:hypothetical protein
MIKLSNTAKQTMRLRLAVHAKTGGRCFYCGIHVRCGTEPLPVDWLTVRGTVAMVPEHAIPVSRGGVDGVDNRLPSCGGCNAAKGMLTVEEFRLLRGLRAGNASRSFPGEEEAGPTRDWICCHSPIFERKIFLANFPWADNAYARGRPLGRSGRPARRGRSATT